VSRPGGRSHVRNLVFDQLHGGTLLPQRKIMQENGKSHL
jgi:hypothetical protein